MNATEMKTGQSVRHEGLDWTFQGLGDSSKCDGCEQENGRRMRFIAYDHLHSETLYAYWCVDCVDHALAYDEAR